jgi:hypothetical protein
MAGWEMRGQGARVGERLDRTRNIRRRWAWLAGLALLGCHQTVDFNVLRAARVNVRGMTQEGLDPTVSVGEWGGVDASAAADIGQRLRELVTNAPGGVVRFAESDGVVKLDGSLREYRYQEEVTSRSDTCSRYDQASNKSVSYSCTHYTRSGEARINVSMNVVDQTGKTVGADSFIESVPMSTSSTDEAAPAIAWADVMESLRRRAADRLSRLVVPHLVTVEKRWFGCGAANAACKAGLVQLRHGNFDPAQALFRQAVQVLQAAPKLDPEALAAAWWAVTLSQEFSGDFQGARASLEQAIRFDPENEFYAAETSQIEDEKSNAERLSRQGVASR